MRVAIDAHALNGPHQGVRSYVENIGRVIAALDRSIDYVMLTDTPLQPAPNWGPNVRFETWSGGRLSRLTGGAAFDMRRLGCTVFHCSYFLPIFPVPNPLVTLHDLLPETHPHLFSYRFRVAARAWFRASARRARHVFTVSEYARGVLVERYRLPPDKVSITANGVDFERFRGGRGQDPSEVEPTLRTGDYLLMVGRLDPRKNHGTALDALARLRERRSDLPRLVIAGSAGSAEGAIRERIQNLGLSRQVLILRDVDSALLPRLYANALATISTSIGEGFGLPLVEAMAAGCAVICADNTAQTEVVAGSGLLFDSGDADALADLLERVIDDNALRGELVRLGTIRAREFDWRVGASAMLDRLRRFEPAA